MNWAIRLRLKLLLPFSCRWNAWVRDITALLEKKFCSNQLTEERDVLRKALDRATQIGEPCIDCGIPMRWCQVVSSSPEHCWRWDYERFDDMATDLDTMEEALREIANDRARGFAAPYRYRLIARNALTTLSKPDGEA
jgi:hypothetical protein